MSSLFLKPAIIATVSSLVSSSTALGQLLPVYFRRAATATPGLRPALR
jgi:hypothetical protein